VLKHKASEYAATDIRQLEYVAFYKASDFERVSGTIIRNGDGA